MATFPLGERGLAAIIPEALSDLHSNDRSVLSLPAVSVIKFLQYGVERPYDSYVFR